jgi:hypothetical protein
MIDSVIETDAEKERLRAVKTGQQTMWSSAHDDLLALLRTQDRGDGKGLVVPSDYLETVFTR